MSWTDSVRSLAAASSIASGSPSRRRTISTTAPTVRGVDDRVDPRGRAAVGEQLHRRARQRVLHAGVGGRHPERRDGDDRLAEHAQRLAAGQQHPHLRTGAEQRIDELGDGVEQVLAVVEQQQRRPSGQRLRQPGQDVGRGASRRTVEQGGLAQPERPGDGGGDVLAIGDCRQVDEPHPVGQLRLQRRADLDGEPGLARAARPDQRHEPGGAQRGPDPGELAAAADEAGEPGAQTPGRRSPGWDGRLDGSCGGSGDGGRGGSRGGRRCGDLAAEHGDVRRRQLGRRVDAELVGQPPAHRVRRLQRLRLPARGRQRPHQRRCDPLVQGVVGRERAQPVDGRGAAAEFGVGQGELGAQPGVGHADGRRGERVVRTRSGAGGTVERVAAPQPGRGREVAQRGLEVTGPGRGGAVGDEPVRSREVGVGVEAVAARRRPQRSADARLVQDTAYAGDQGLQRAGRVGGCPVRPHGLGQCRDGHRTAGVEGQPGDEASQARPGDRQRHARRAGHLERTENGDLHADHGRSPRQDGRRGDDDADRPHR